LAAAEQLIPHDEESDEDFVENSSGDDSSGEDVSDEEGSDEDNESEQGTSAAGEDSEESSEKSADKLEPLICSICLNMRNAEGDRVIQCDKCGVAVHEGCYAVPDIDDNASVISNCSTEPWFCEPCLFNVEKPPHCELCPQQFGALKRADVGGKWIHLVCGLYTPGISFGDVENLSAVSWQEVDYKRFGRKACDGCSNVLESRTGITTGCEAGLCKNHYHITCAQR
jgi:hypothetical protein